jgi:hypothetical protein
MWIVQEIGTPAPATLFWGNSQIDWEVLARVADGLGRYYHLRRRFAIWTPHIRYLYQRFVDTGDEPGKDGGGRQSGDRNRRNFVYELHRARHLHAKDPRDHVYGMLGHFSFHSGSWSLKKLEADYTKSVEQTFMDLAVLELRGARELILLGAVQHESLPRSSAAGPKSGMKLPSWVPDWTQDPIHLLSDSESPHRACGDTVASLETDEETRTLFIQGVRIDTIAACSQTLYSRDLGLGPGTRPQTVLSIWRDICGRETFDLEHAYVNGESALLAFTQTLANGCVGTAIRAGRPYHSISKTEWLSHGAAYIHGILSSPSGKHPQPAKPVPSGLADVAIGGDAYKWSHEATLVSRFRRVSRTEGGYFVLGPHVMEVGDVVCVLLGGKTPFILRPLNLDPDTNRNVDGDGDRDDRGNGNDGGGYLLVGECYVHGLMCGEAIEMMRRGEVREECFRIR